MNYRKATLLAETSLTTGTKTIDINVRDLISRIVIAWRISRAGAGMDAFCHEDITKIELVDGSEVLHGLNGGENQAICIYDRKCPTMNHGQHAASLSDYSTYAIDFGRFLYDPLYAFDPKLFVNPQLKITYNYRVCDTGAIAGNMEIWADLFDEKAISPVGFLAAREIKDFTVATASVYDYTDLPVDRVIRKLFIQGFKDTYSPWDTVIEARLSEDGDKRIPFDLELEDYHRMMKGVWTAVEELITGTADQSGAHFFVTPTDYYALANVIGQGARGIYMHGWGSGGDIHLYSDTGGAIQFSGAVRGYLPNHVFEFPFGDPMDPADWYDVTRLGSLELRVKCGGQTGGHIRTFIQQVRQY